MTLLASTTSLFGIIGNSPAAASFTITDLASKSAATALQSVSQIVHIIPNIGITIISQLISILI